MGAIAEVVGRLKTNGHLREYSPASRMIELEMLAAGITTKRNLWRALRVTDRPELATDELDRLIARATSQLERVLDAHERALPKRSTDPRRDKRRSPRAARPAPPSRAIVAATIHRQAAAPPWASVPRQSVATSQ